MADSGPSEAGSGIIEGCSMDCSGKRGRDNMGIDEMSI